MSYSDFQWMNDPLQIKAKDENKFQGYWDFMANPNRSGFNPNDVGNAQKAIADQNTGRGLSSSGQLIPPQSSQNLNQSFGSDVIRNQMPGMQNSTPGIASSPAAGGSSQPGIMNAFSRMSPAGSQMSGQMPSTNQLGQRPNSLMQHQRPTATMNPIRPITNAYSQARKPGIL